MKKLKFIPIVIFLSIALLMVSCQDDDYMDVSPEEETEVEILTTAGGIEFVRTPEAQFENLPDWRYDYKYVEIDGLRQAYAEAGPANGEVVLLLHGQPTWSYLYRKMIPVLADAGYRVIAMDHLGMGRSDKPIDIDDYTYLGHTDRLERFITGLGLQDIHLFVQDWGSLIGLKVAGENTDWFASTAVGNGGLPTLPGGVDVFPVVENPNEIINIPSPFTVMPAQQPSFYDGCELLIESSVNGFGNWMEYAMKAESFHTAEVIEFNTYFPVPEQVLAAYDAPYPERVYMAGIRKLPSLINEVGGNTEVATQGLSQFEKPFITIWGGNDFGHSGSCESQQYFIDLVPGAEGQDHVRLPEASHFLQDDQGVEIATRLVEFYESPTPNDNPDPVETGLLNRTFFHDGKQLEYAVYIPTSYTGDVEVPLVVYLHGAPENKEIAQSTTDFTAVAESEGFIMIYPEAGFASSGGFIWAEGRGGNADNSSDDVSYINALVDSVTLEFQVNASKRYLCGFSNGGFMGQNVANQDNSRFAAMATVSASLHETFTNTTPNPISMLYIYGTDDPITNYENGGLPPVPFNVDGWTVPALAIESAVDYWVRINGCNATPTETALTDTNTSDNSTVTVFEYTGGTRNTEVKFYRVNGGGHTWPGVPVSNRPATFFEDTNNDMKAGQEIWNFFNKFELN